MFCHYHILSMGFLLATLLIILVSFEFTSIKADDHDLLAECKQEDVSSWHPWFYEDLARFSWNYALPMGRLGIKCQVQYPYECVCSLSNFTLVKINCTNNITSHTYVTYPSYVTFLSWAHNKLEGIDQNSFSGLTHSLIVLHLNNNNLRYLQAFVFSKLHSLLGLDLSYNLLTQTKSPHVFGGLGHLLVLTMEHNSLDNIDPCTFCELENLITLDLDYNSLTELQLGAFDGLGKLIILALGYNRLEVIQQGVFHGLNLEILKLNNNNLKDIQLGVFNGLGNLDWLYLEHNMLVEIKLGVFEDLGDLKILWLSHNNLKNIQLGAFNDLGNLEELILEHTMLVEIKLGVFEGLGSLTRLHLEHNNLTVLLPSVFHGLVNLGWLYLEHNMLVVIKLGVFEELRNLYVLLPLGIFQNIANLSFLNLSYNNLQDLGSNIFLDTLLTLDLRGNSLLWVTKEDFALLNIATTVFVDNAATCCFVDKAECSPDSIKTPFLTCQRLLGFDVLRVGIWLVSILAISSNVFGVYTRYKHRAQSNKVQFLLITNLAISDFCMGIYLLFLLSVDLYYQDYFPSHSETWRNSSFCKVAGALSVLSSEASVFFITMISIDRALAIKFPFRAHRLGSKYARKLVCVLWMVAIVISISTFVLSGINPDIYALSEICVGLPISRQQLFNATKTEVSVSRIYIVTASKLEQEATGSKASLYYSIGVFTCINLLCFSIVGICYTSILFMARKSTRRSGRDSNINEEIKMAKKMFLLVFTDFCCWVPLGVLSILVQAGIVTTPPVAYAWIATFILPINSSLNPFLYTLGDVLADKVSCSSCSCRKCKKQGPDEALEMQPQR